MLLHAPIQRHIILFSPPSEWVQEQHRFLVATLQQSPPGVLHQERVAVVHRIPQLEGEDYICKKGGGCGSDLSLLAKYSFSSTVITQP